MSDDTDMTTDELLNELGDRLEVVATDLQNENVEAAGHELWNTARLLREETEWSG